MRKTLVGVFALLLLAGAVLGEVKVVGETTVQPYKLVRLEVKDLPANTTVRWRITPRIGVDKSSNASGSKLEFVAPPGAYAVDAETTTVDWDRKVFTQDEGSVTVTIADPAPPVPPLPPVPPPAPKVTVIFPPLECE